MNLKSRLDRLEGMNGNRFEVVIVPPNGDRAGLVADARERVGPDASLFVISRQRDGDTELISWELGEASGALEVHPDTGQVGAGETFGDLVELAREVIAAYDELESWEGY